MLKGVLEGCILAIISKKEVYGYEMTTQLSDFGLNSVSEGSIYPILLKLQKENLIVSEMKPSLEGPKRKYYHITESGKIYLQAWQKDWQELANSVTNILNSIKEEKI